MALDVRLNGNDKAAIKELHQLGIIASIERGSVAANVTTEQLTFVNEYAEQIRKWIDDGVIGSSPGLYEGLQVDIFEGSTKVFDGYTDLITDFEIVDPTTVKCRIKKHDSNDNLIDQASGLTAGLLVELGQITSADYILIPYVNNKEFNFIEFAFIIFSIYSISRDLLAQFTKLQEQINQLQAHLSGGVTGPIAGALLLIVQLVLNAAFAFLMLSFLVDMIKQLFNHLISPVKFHKGIKVRKLLDKMAANLGLTYNTTIADIDDLGILPSKFGIDQDEQHLKIFTETVIIQPGVGIPSASDFGYFFDDLLELVNRTFMAEFTLKDGVIEQHAENSTWWTQLTSDYSLGDPLKPPLHESQTFNASELASDKLILFRHDIKDVNTLENFKGTTFEIKTRPINTTDSRNVLLKGFEKVEIPYALGNRKTELNNFEKLVRSLFEIVDRILIAFGGNGGNAQKINARIGMLKLETDYVNIPKLMKLNSENKLFVNDRDIWSAKYLYFNYINFGSFVLNNFGGQYRLFKGVKVAFGFEQFNQLIENLYFSDGNGDPARLEKIDWQISPDFALLDYRVRHIFTKNLQETYIEQE